MSKFCPVLHNYITYQVCQECDNKICKMPKFYCLVTGSQNFEDYSLLKNKLDLYLKNYSHIVIVTDNTKNMNLLIQKYILERNYQHKKILKDYDLYGNNIDYANYLKLQSHCGVVIFLDNRNIKPNVQLYKILHIPYKIVYL